MIRILLTTLAIGSAAVAALTLAPAAIAERAVAIPAAAQDVPATPRLQTAVLAGGCFWTMSTMFEHVRGVKHVTSGYAGGRAADATYDQVSTERTRHAEAVRITYDPRQVSFATLLRVYFSVAHDPTQVGGQGPDSGPSYRSAIFPQSIEQTQVAAAYIRQLTAAHVYKAPITTKLERGNFFPAEAYHQNFFDKNPNHPYFVMWDKPKLAAFRASYPQLYS